MIVGLAHVCLIVKDLDRSIDFYCNQLGVTKAFEFVNDQGQRYGAYLHLGGRTFLELFAGSPQPAPEGAYRHLCLEVASLSAYVGYLRARGIEVTDVKRGKDHSDQAWLSDPDGNKIELHEYTRQSWQKPSLR